MFHIFISLIVLLSFGTAKADEHLKCFAGKIRHAYLGSIQVEKANYCINSSVNTLRSSSCVSGTCDAERAAKNVQTIRLDELDLRFGNPAFQLCRVLGGRPQLVEVWASGAWYKLDRCYFDSDDSFINCGTLMGLTRRTWL